MKFLVTPDYVRVGHVHYGSVLSLANGSLVFLWSF